MTRFFLHLDNSRRCAVKQFIARAPLFGVGASGSCLLVGAISVVIQCLANSSRLAHAPATGQESVLLVPAVGRQGRVPGYAAEGATCKDISNEREYYYSSNTEVKQLNFQLVVYITTRYSCEKSCCPKETRGRKLACEHRSGLKCGGESTRKARNQQ